MVCIVLQLLAVGIYGDEQMKTNNYTGKNFEWEIRKSLDDAGCWWFRIQDTNDVSRFVKKLFSVNTLLNLDEISSIGRTRLELLLI